jgi:hypothetical protein
MRILLIYIPYARKARDINATWRPFLYRLSPDEKYVTEHAYDNPKFIEDMVRDVAAPSSGLRPPSPRKRGEGMII